MSAGLISGPVSSGTWVVIDSGTNEAVDIQSIPTGLKVLRLVMLCTSGTKLSLRFNGSVGGTDYYDPANHGVDEMVLASHAAGTTHAVIDIINVSGAEKSVTAAVRWHFDAHAADTIDATGGTWIVTDEINRIVEPQRTATFWVLMGSSVL